MRIVLQGFSAPICHASSFIDLENTALAKKRSVKDICMFAGSDSTHMVDTSPVNFKQRGRFFWGNRAPGVLRLLVTSRAV